MVARSLCATTQLQLTVVVVPLLLEAQQQERPHPS